ncbi:ATP-dependent helicase [uncultured Clostridium sp.]|uniref:ATP-dependent helicase n=1 Tax=uncultured Clostridium sp. TaxID=59620 RepID=UPI0025F22E9D|nr:ATP-dependent helicase [uncultured Clostridium sp.]
MENTNELKKVGMLTASSTCKKAVDFNFDSKTVSVADYAKKNRIVVDAIVNALKYNVRALTQTAGYSPYQNEKEYSRAVMEYMNTRYDEIGGMFMNYQQRQEQLLWDHRRVMRYLLSEAEIPSFPEEQEVELDSKLYVLVKPDMVFECGNHIRVVFLKDRKNHQARKGSPEEAEKKVQLFAGILYGRKLGYQSIESSFYNLRKSSDRSNWSQCEQSFFGSSNVESMLDIYQGVKNDLDEEMKPFIQMYVQGRNSEDMPERCCERCKYYDICKYELPAIQVKDETESISAKKAEVNYTDAQKEVINTLSGVTRVIAAAGSGKTQTVAGRVANLLKNGSPAESILCITFSNAGANEMRRKIARQLVDTPEIENVENMKIMTFHSFENEIAKENWNDLGFKRNLTVINDVQRYSIIARILKEHPIFEWGGKSFLNFTAGKMAGRKGALCIVSDIFSQIKNLGRDVSTIFPSDIILESDIEIDFVVIDEIIKRFQYYEAECLEKGLIDFDDMEKLAFTVIDNNENYLSKYGFEHIIIDEFQDSSEWQMELIKRLVQTDSFKSLMLVGDDAQAIYGFRNTTPEYILNFQQYLNSPFQYKGEHSVSYKENRMDVDDIMLTDNWRSKQEILDSASNLLELNHNQISKKINAGRGNGGNVRIQAYRTADEEYLAIVKDIKNRIDSGEDPDDMAVLAYTKSELKKVAAALTLQGIPSMFGAPEPLMENSRIRAVLSFAKVISDQNNVKDAAIVANALYRAEAVAETGLMDLAETEVNDRIDNVIAAASQIQKNPSPKKQKEMFVEFINSFALNDEAVQHFVEQFDFMNFEDVLKYCKDFVIFGTDEEFRRIGNYHGVKLITAHSSKGLEWKSVYFTVNGIAKAYSTSTRRNTAEVEELRRLEFVAMTRARDYLSVSGTYLRKSKSLEYVTNIPMYEIYTVSGMENQWKTADKFPPLRKTA